MVARVPTRAVSVAAQPAGTLVTVTMVIATLPGLSTSGVTDTTGAVNADADDGTSMGSITVAAAEIVTATLVRVETFKAATSWDQRDVGHPDVAQRSHHRGSAHG